MKTYRWTIDGMIDEGSGEYVSSQGEWVRREDIEPYLPMIEKAEEIAGEMVGRIINGDPTSDVRPVGVLHGVVEDA